MEDPGELPPVNPIIPSLDPVLEDIVGKPKEFTDDFQLYKGSEGIFSSMGVTAPSTYLLEGVPGTGKTFGIHALNNTYNKSVVLKHMLGEELHRDDFNLIVFEYALGKHGSSYINKGSLIVQHVFDVAGGLASIGKPTLLFIDEADAVLAKRDGATQSHAEDKKVLETIMKNLQVAHDTPNFYVVLATNIPGQCDEASLRAGRIDRRYHFKLPTLSERVTAYESFINKSCENAGYKVIRQYNSEKLADMSDGFSYADIRQSVDGAVIQRAKELALTKNKGIITAGYVTQKRLEKALMEHGNEFKTRKNPQKRKIGF